MSVLSLTTMYGPSLPDDRLWEAHKKVARQLPDPLSHIPQEIRSRLCIGDELALAHGSNSYAPHYPAGDCMGEIWKAATGMDMVEWVGRQPGDHGPGKEILRMLA